MSTDLVAIQKDVVANHGVEALVKYIDIKLDGGFE